MTTGMGPHDRGEPGYIVAWRSKKAFQAGKYPDQVMSYGEALDKAEEMSANNPELTFWAEHTPEHIEPH